MRARLTFTDKVVWNYKTFMAWEGFVQGCPERSGWTLIFRPDIALTDKCFEGTVMWDREPKNEKLISGTKFQYLMPSNGQAFALGEIL